MALTRSGKHAQLAEAFLQRVEQEVYCPLCACILNPGEKLCLDCLLDMMVEGAG